MTVAILLCGLLVVAFLGWRFAYFLRNPARSIPPGDSILSAADGYVTYVKRVAAGSVPIAIKNRRAIPLSEYAAIEATDGMLVGVFMTAFSVHRNRIPVSGTVVFKRHQPAPRNLSMVRMMTNLFFERKPFENECDFLVTNERLTIGVRTDAGVVGVTQIADAWIDRIVARVEVGDAVRRGEQYGLIRFGSQVDLFIPDSLGMRPVVSPGQYVWAGESVIAVRA